MYYPVTGWMLFDDQLTLGGSQDLLQPPVILTSGNGWIYKPDEARTPQEIKRGTNKAWPRVRGDYRTTEYHSAWHTEYMQDQLGVHRNWALPTKIERPQLSPHSSGGNAFAIHWNSAPWGWQHISLDIHEPRGYGHNNKLTLIYSIQTHPAAIWYEDQKVDSVYSSGGGRSNTIQSESRDEVRNAVRRWMIDPWGEAVAHIGGVSQFKTAEIMKPPIEKMKSVEYLDERSDEDFYGLQTGSAEFWTKGKIEQVMKSDVAWKAMQKVFKAFEFTGYSVRVTTEYSYRDDEDMPITGIEISIPDDPDSTKRSRKTGHSISIDRDGISVTCGFVQDEQAWMDREKRMAASHMALLEEDLFTEFSIDLNE